MPCWPLLLRLTQYKYLNSVNAGLQQTWTGVWEFFYIYGWRLVGAKTQHQPTLPWNHMSQRKTLNLGIQRWCLVLQIGLVQLAKKTEVAPRTTLRGAALGYQHLPRDSSIQPSLKVTIGEIDWQISPDFKLGKNKTKLLMWLCKL